MTRRTLFFAENWVDLAPRLLKVRSLTPELGDFTDISLLVQQHGRNSQKAARTKESD